MTGDAISRLRHELRTPVNHIIGYSELLIEDADDQRRLDRVGGLRPILDCGKRVLKGINQALPSAAEGRTADPSSLPSLLSGPLAEIILACENLEQAIDGPDRDEFLADLGKIRVAAKRLHGLADQSSRLDASAGGD